MNKKHRDQIDAYLQVQSEPHGWVFDQNDILVGTIEDTSESFICLSLLGNIIDEVWPEAGRISSNENYYEVASALSTKGYQIINAEWWYRKLHPDYSIESLPKTKLKLVLLRFEDGSQSVAMLLPAAEASDDIPIYDSYTALH